MWALQSVILLCCHSDILVFPWFVSIGCKPCLWAFPAILFEMDQNLLVSVGEGCFDGSSLSRSDRSNACNLSPILLSGHY